MSSRRRAELLIEIAARIAAVRRDHPVRVAVDGIDAAGKTTLADQLVEPLRELGRSVIRASIDGFHRPAAQRYRRGRTSAEGYYRDSFDHRGLLEALLAPLGPAGDRRYRRALFDFRSDAPVEVPLERAAADAILLFDGVFLLRPELREHWDLSIFVRAGFGVTLARAQERDRELLGDLDTVRRRYRQRYIPGQRLYLAEARPESRAWMVIDNDDPERPRLVRAAGVRAEDASRPG